VAVVLVVVVVELFEVELLVVDEQAPLTMSKLVAQELQVAGSVALPSLHVWQLGIYVAQSTHDPALHYIAFWQSVIKLHVCAVAIVQRPSTRRTVSSLDVRVILIELGNKWRE
jgi:hypothetical protein